MGTESQDLRAPRGFWKTFSGIAGLRLIAALLLAGCVHEDGDRTGLTRLAASDSVAFRSEFNNASDRSRVLVLLSPT